MLNGARNETIRKAREVSQSDFIFDFEIKYGRVETLCQTLGSEREQLNKKVEVVPLGSGPAKCGGWLLAKRFGIEEGQTLSGPIIEFYYKNDDLDDPFINEDHIDFLQIATSEEVDYIKAETYRINDLLKALVCSDWLLNLIDFKLEFGKIRMEN